MSWTPPPRAAWVDKLVAVGRSLGDDGRALVPLDPDDLLASTEAVTGLHDWGDDWFLGPYRTLLTALDEEAHLHLPGRLRTRTELQRILQNRLRLVDLWRREPTLVEAPVPAPVFVTGLGRSGTTLLHEMLALDPRARAPRLWEFMYSVPPPAAATYAQDPRASAADAEITVMDEMVPAVTAMHENRGFLPTDCIFAFAHQFSTDMFTGLWNVPSYVMARAGGDRAPEYAWHRRMLATLQSRHPGRWVLKAPSHLSALPALFAEYPDARVVITHRDPLRVVGSLADLMATLQWMDSDRVDHGAIAGMLGAGLAYLMDQVTADRDAGRVPAGQITDIVYADLVADPVSVVHRLYAHWDLPVTDEFDRRLRAYVAERHQGRDRVHHYRRFEDTGLDLHEHRSRLRAYQDRFGVPSEVGG